MTRAENITPSMLTWARETAGLSIEDAAARVGLKSNSRGTAKEKLEALERGVAKPTRNQLIRFAATYRRPLTVFYRSTPPVAGHRGEDFRTLAAVISKEEAGLLEALLRDIRVRQDMVRAILEDDEDVHPLAFVSSMTVSLHIADAAQTIRQELGIGESPALRELTSPSELFAKLREWVEGIGIFVLLVGNLGSHHTNISERVFRGFAIADDIAPFIVINDQDAAAAWSFTLIHELAHIFTGFTGVSNAPYPVTTDTRPARVERFCNDVASEFLLPQRSLGNFSILKTLDSAARVISDVAAERNVSEAMVAYRFWRTDRIDDEIYRRLATAYAARWQEAKERRRERTPKEDAGPSYYTVRKHRLGNALLNLVGRTLRANDITHTRAARMLGVKTGSVEPLFRNREAKSPMEAERKVRQLESSEVKDAHENGKSSTSLMHQI